MLGERTRKRYQSCLVFQSGELRGVVVAQEGCDEESFSPSEGCGFEFWKTRNGKRDLRLSVILARQKLSWYVRAGETPDFVAFRCLQMQVGVEQN